tara:strand:+ start:4349 stop:4633 length:285 start_codon:yes stop_codon:yes gene_type:complete
MTRNLKVEFVLFRAGAAVRRCLQGLYRDPAATLAQWGGNDPRAYVSEDLIETEQRIISLDELGRFYFGGDESWESEEAFKRGMRDAGLDLGMRV